MKIVNPKKGILSIILTSFLFLIVAPAVPVVSAEDVMATYIIDNPTDKDDINQGDGICATESNNCTLRAAIQESNLDQKESAIKIGVSTIYIDNQLPSIDDEKLTIIGNDAIIDAQEKSEFFDVSEDSDVTIKGVTFQNAYKSDFDGNIIDDGASISVWINPKSNGEGGAARILSKNEKWILFMVSNGTNTKDYVRFGFYQKFTDNAGQWESVSSDLNLAKNQWSHIAVTYKNNSESQKPSLYINGEKINMITTSTPKGEVVKDEGDNNLYIGNNDIGSRTFDGLIDDLGIFNRILTPEEIKKLSVMPIDASANGLVAHWQFDEKSGETTAVDNMKLSDGEPINTNFVKGKFNNAVSFSGESGYIKVNDNPAIQNVFDATGADGNPSNTFTSFGGAISNEGKLTLDNVTIKNGKTFINTGTIESNQNLHFCGGVVSNTGNLTLTNSQIANNKSLINNDMSIEGLLLVRGGAVCNAGSESSLTIDNSTISDNKLTVNSFDNNTVKFLSIFGGAVASYKHISKNLYVGNASDADVFTKPSNLNIINNSKITNNSIKVYGKYHNLDVYGGGVYSSGNLQIDSSEISGNTVDADVKGNGYEENIGVRGGGLYTSNMENVQFSDEFLENGDPLGYLFSNIEYKFDGYELPKGMDKLEFYDVNTPINNYSITNSKFNQNSIDMKVDNTYAADVEGGGIYFMYAHEKLNLPINNSEINNNKAHIESVNEPDGYITMAKGGGIGSPIHSHESNDDANVYSDPYYKDATLIVENTSIDGNSLSAKSVAVPKDMDHVSALGAGMYLTQPTKIISSSINNNELIEGESLKGSALTVHVADVDITNTTISSNKGGRFVERSPQSNISYTNATITNNSLKEGVDFVAPYSFQKIKNTIVDLPKNDNQCVDFKEDSNSLGHNMFTKLCEPYSGVSGETSVSFVKETDILNVDPKLGELKNNGGSTLTHELLEGSPAMDKIPESECTDMGGNSLTTDQREFERPINKLCDIGAVEDAEGSTDMVAADTDGATTDPADTDGATTDSADTDGATTDSADTDGTTTDPADTDGTTTDPADTDGTTTDPADTDGATTDSADTDGTTTDPADTYGTTTDPADTDGTTTDPANTDGTTTDNMDEFFNFLERINVALPQEAKNDIKALFERNIAEEEIIRYLSDIFRKYRISLTDRQWNVITDFIRVYLAEQNSTNDRTTNVREITTTDISTVETIDTGRITSNTTSTREATIVPDRSIEVTPIRRQTTRRR